jgi:hypothetical protein
MGYGYTPFDPGFSFEDPTEEERKRRELEAQEASQLRMAMETEPSWDQPDVDVGGRLPDVEEPKRSTEGSIDDTAAVAGAAAEGDVDYIKNFEQHLAKRPDREDYEPSTLRKILSVIGGTLAGGNPAVTRKLAGYGEYDEAMGDWAQEGRGLADVADLREAQAREGGLAEGRRVSERGSKRTAETAAVGHELEGGRLDLGEAELAEKKRAAGVAEPLAERETVVSESEADTAAKRAGHYGRSVDALADYRTGKPEEISLTQQDKLEELAIQDVINMNPEWKRFVQTDPSSGMAYDPYALEPGEPGEERSFLGIDYLYPDKKSTLAADDPEYDEFMLALEAARRRRGGTAGLEDIPPLPRE